MNRFLLLIGCLGLFLLSGCTTVASQRYVAFGTAGQTMDQQYIDTGQCEAIAQTHKASDADAAAAMGSMGLAAGALSGAAYGAVLGAVGRGISAGSGSLIGLGVGAAVGLTVGVIQGLQANQRRYEAIFLACMTARRYTLGG